MLSFRNKFRFMIAAASALMLTVLSGCYPIYDGQSNDNFGSKTEGTRQGTSRAYQTRQQYTPVIHNYGKLEMSQYLSDQVQTIDGVNSSIVMLADNTAFVALQIDNTATGTHGYAPKGPDGGESGETNNMGYVRGLYNPHRPLNDNYNPNLLNDGVNNYETVRFHQFLTHEFKQRIAEKVRAAQPTVHDVYISANRDFLNQLNMYAQEAWKGNSLQPFLPEFNASVASIFGTAPTYPENEH